MQVQVTQVSDVKPGRFGGMSSKLHAGNDFYYVNEDATQYVGKTVEIEVTQPPGKNYKTAKISKVAGATGNGNGKSNGKVEWKEYEMLARVAHKLALELEPDTLGYPGDGNEPTGNEPVVLDRSRARVTFVNTALMALKDNKLWLDDDLPF